MFALPHHSRSRKSVAQVAPPHRAKKLRAIALAVFMPLWLTLFAYLELVERGWIGHLARDIFFAAFCVFGMACLLLFFFSFTDTAQVGEQSSSPDEDERASIKGDIGK